MTANEIMRYVRKWHEQIGDMPSKQAGPNVRQIYREMQRVILAQSRAIDSKNNIAKGGSRRAAPGGPAAPNVIQKALASIGSDGAGTG